MVARGFPGGGEAPCALGLSLDSAFAGWHPAEPLLGRLVGVAQSSGIRVFDSADSIQPRRTEAMVGRLSRLEPGTIWVIGRSPRDLGVEEGSLPGDAGPSPIEVRLRESLPRVPSPSEPRLWIEWRPTPSERVWDDAAAEALGNLEESGAIAGWVAHVDQPNESARLPHHRPLSGEISLLDRQWDGPLRSAVVTASFLARDPLASGRLDGTRWTRSGLSAGGRAAPTPLRRMQEEAAPILRFGFLTEGGKRTLAQAAIQYVAGLPGVVAVLAPLPAAERLAELIDFATTPPLSAEERRRLGGDAGPGPLPPAPMSFEPRRPELGRWPE